MPSTSKKQARTMTAACKSPKFRKKVKIPKDVACDFHDEDKGKFHESMFGALMDGIAKEDILSDKEKKLAKDLLSQSPILDVILDPDSSYKDFVEIRNKLEKKIEAEQDAKLNELNENMSPSQFLKVGRHLIEVQLGWENKQDRIARSTVFEDGRKIGHYYFAGKDYRVDEENDFKTVEEAIAHLIKTNGRKQYAQSQDNYVGSINNF